MAAGATDRTSFSDACLINTVHLPMIAFAMVFTSGKRHVHEFELSYISEYNTAQHSTATKHAQTRKIVLLHEALDVLAHSGLRVLRE